MTLIRERDPVEERYEGLNELTAYAVQLRYDATEPDARPVDRRDALQTLSDLRDVIGDRLSQVLG